MSMSEFILLADGHYSHYRLWRIWPIVGWCDSCMTAAAIVGIKSESEVKIGAQRTMASMSSRVMGMAWRRKGPGFKMLALLDFGMSGMKRTNVD